MNALISFRANAVGNLTPNRVQRQESAEKIASSLTARIAGMQRALAKSAAASAKSVESAAKANTETESTEETSRTEMDKDSFLQLLVMELQHQDPTDPVDNREMVAQLAQFSALEASTNLNESFTDFFETFKAYSGNMDQLNFITAQNMLGNYIEGYDVDGEAITGTVDSVHLDGSIVVLSVENRYVPMTGVLSVSETRPTGT